MTKFKRGDIRKDGKVFYGYQKGREYWTSPKQLEKERNRVTKAEDDSRQTKGGHARYILKGCKKRADQLGISFDIVASDICDSAPDVCPILGFRLSWGERKGKSTDNSPSLDRIDPSRGYIEGNVQWISYMANRMKSNATLEQLKTFANWILTNV